MSSSFPEISLTRPVVKTNVEAAEAFIDFQRVIGPPQRGKAGLGSNPSVTIPPKGTHAHRKLVSATQGHSRGGFCCQGSSAASPGPMATLGGLCQKRFFLEVPFSYATKHTVFHTVFHHGREYAPYVFFYKKCSKLNGIR